jgi:tetratricopeptide (TPR) repeat protein
VKSGSAIRAAAAGVLRTIRDIDVLDTAADGAVAISAKIRKGTTGLELVPMLGTTEAAPIPLVSSGEATAQFLRWAGEALKLDATKISIPSNPVVLESYGAAVAGSKSEVKEERAKAVADLKKTINADPNFLPAQLLGVDVLSAAGDRAGAVAAARKVVELDPTRLDVARQLARWEIDGGEPAAGITSYGGVLKSVPDDAEALAAVGAYALATGEVAHFEAAMQKLAGKGAASLHEPDRLLFAGKIDAVASKYYDIEANEPGNPVLSLKIGRIAVLRRSPEIAKIELDKLEKSDPAYSAHILKAYIAAQKNDAVAAKSELDAAAAAGGRDFYTSSTDVYAMLNQPKKAIEMIGSAVAHGEPTYDYVLNNPLYRYLQSDAGWRSATAKIEAQKAAVAAALASLPV